MGGLQFFDFLVYAGDGTHEPSASNARGFHVDGGKLVSWEESLNLPASCATMAGLRNSVCRRNCSLNDLPVLSECCSARRTFNCAQSHSKKVQPEMIVCRECVRETAVCERRLGRHLQLLGGRCGRSTVLRC